MQYDLALGKQHKEEGMALAAENRADQLALAREVARLKALDSPNKTCNADTVMRELSTIYGIDSLGPATGSIFRTTDWRFTGHWTPSRRVTNHARMIRVWEFVGA